MSDHTTPVIPVKTGIRNDICWDRAALDSRFHGNDRRNLYSLITVLFLLLFSCSVQKAEKQLQPVTDEAGRNVAVPVEVNRIVSLTPGLTEMLFYLGLEKRVVGVTSFCNYPAAAEKIEKIGGYSTPSLEKIVSVKPDLVLATTEGNTRPVVDKMSGMGLSVYCVSPATVDDIPASLRRLGGLTGVAEAAGEKADSLQARIDAVRGRISGGTKPRVLLIIGENPLYTVGPGSFAHDILVSAGAENIAGDSPVRYPKYGMEEVLGKDPQIIIKCGMVKEKCENDLFSGWRKWKNVSAVKNGHLYNAEPNWLLRPGPRLVDGLEKVAEIVSGYRSNE